MSQIPGSDCRKCVFFKAHDLFDYIDYCSIRKELVIPEHEECPHYREVTRDQLAKIIREQGWLYCITCRKVIHSVEELDEYLNKHIIVQETFSDDVASEESPAADESLFLAHSKSKPIFQKSKPK